MGFSVSASTAIIFVGALLAFGMMFPTVMDGSQRLGEAQATQSDRILQQQNTAIAINDTEYDDAGDELVVTVDNEGTTTLAVDETDVLIDGRYGIVDATTVDGIAETNIWAPGTTLEMTFENVTTEPDTVKVVTELGVSVRTDDVGGEEGA